MLALVLVVVLIELMVDAHHLAQPSEVPAHQDLCRVWEERENIGTALCVLQSHLQDWTVFIAPHLKVVILIKDSQERFVSSSSPSSPSSSSSSPSLSSSSSPSSSPELHLWQRIHQVFPGSRWHAGSSEDYSDTGTSSPTSRLNAGTGCTAAKYGFNKSTCLIFSPYFWYFVTLSHCVCLCGKDFEPAHLQESWAYWWWGEAPQGEVQRTLRQGGNRRGRGCCWRRRWWWLTHPHTSASW